MDRAAVFGTENEGSTPPGGTNYVHSLCFKKSKRRKIIYRGYKQFQKKVSGANDGKSKSTRYRKPFRFVYKEEYKTRSEAMKREWFFKNTTEGNKLMRVLIKD